MSQPQNSYWPSASFQLHSGTHAPPATPVLQVKGTKSSSGSKFTDHKDSDNKVGPAYYPAGMIPKAYQFANSGVVELIAGQGIETETFYVHKSILIKLSDYFRAALDGPFTEAKDQKITWKEEHPATVRCFVAFIYHRRIEEEELQIMTGNPTYSSANRDDRIKNTRITLCRLFALSQMIMMNSLHYYVREKINADNYSKAFPAECWNIVFTHGDEDFKKSFASKAVNHVKSETLIKTLKQEDVPREAILLVMEIMVDVNKTLLKHTAKMEKPAGFVWA